MRIHKLKERHILKVVRTGKYFPDWDRTGQEIPPKVVVNIADMVIHTYKIRPTEANVKHVDGMVVDLFVDGKIKMIGVTSCGKHFSS